MTLPPVVGMRVFCQVRGYGKVISLSGNFTGFEVQFDYVDGPVYFADYRTCCLEFIQ